MREFLALAFGIVHFETYLTTTDCEEIMGTIVQGKNGFRTRQVPILAYQHQRIWWTYQRLLFVCLCNSKREKKVKAAYMRETDIALFLAFAGQWSIATVCSHWKKHMLKLFGIIKVVVLLSTEQPNLFQEILSIWQPVRELVMLPWLTQYQHANVGLSPIF